MLALAKTKASSSTEFSAAIPIQPVTGHAYWLDCGFWGPATSSAYLATVLGPAVDAPDTQATSAKGSGPGAPILVFLSHLCAHIQLVRVITGEG